MKHYKCECNSGCVHHGSKPCRRRAVLTEVGLRCATCRLDVRLINEEENK